MSFALTVMLNALLPPEKQQVSTGSSRLHHLSASEGGRTGSIMSHHSKKSTAPHDGIQNVAFLGGFYQLLKHFLELMSYRYSE